MTISIIADLLVIIVYAFLLICMLGYILFLIFKPGEPLLPGFDIWHGYEGTLYLHVRQLKGKEQKYLKINK